jgi:hypothetical protein
MQVGVDRANDKGDFRTLYSVNLWDIERISTHWFVRSVFKTDVAKARLERLGFFPYVARIVGVRTWS